MHDDLRNTVARLFPALRSDLEALVRIPSVSAASYDPGPVRGSAQAVADLFAAAGLHGIRLLELEGAHPAVFGELPAPPGAPTVLLYAHHDVQPPGPAEEWETGPFEPFEKNGRLYGRGTSDDKAGVAMHLGAIRAFDGRPPVGIKVFVEGEEEVGSTHLPAFLDAYADLLAADVIVIGDSGNWRAGEPALTTSLRGIVACNVSVRTLRQACHSGEFGGVFPDALTALCRLMATLHDDQGEVAIPGLVTGTAPPLDLTEQEQRDKMGTVPGLQMMGSGGLTTRLWRKPAISVLAIDAPPVREAINQLVPVARAKVSMRIAPEQNGEAALAALRQHLLGHAPFGAEVTIEADGVGEPFELSTSGPAAAAWKEGMRYAWSREPVEMGAGGSIPFVAAFSARYPAAEILLTGVGDPTSAIHAPNESVDLADLEKGVLAEAVALRLVAHSSAHSSSVGPG
jgi:acetylornithine deacetylase/succinyl-diaminopimelate desuccinylase-like protein